MAQRDPVRNESFLSSGPKYSRHAVTSVALAQIAKDLRSAEGCYAFCNDTTPDMHSFTGLLDPLVVSIQMLLAPFLGRPVLRYSLDFAFKACELYDGAGIVVVSQAGWLSHFTAPTKATISEVEKLSLCTGETHRWTLKLLGTSTSSFGLRSIGGICAIRRSVSGLRGHAVPQRFAVSGKGPNNIMVVIVEVTRGSFSEVRTFSNGLPGENKLEGIWTSPFFDHDEQFLTFRPRGKDPRPYHLLFQEQRKVEDHRLAGYLQPGTAPPTSWLVSQIQPSQDSANGINGSFAPLGSIGTWRGDRALADMAERKATVKMSAEREQQEESEEEEEETQPMTATAKKKAKKAAKAKKERALGVGLAPTCTSTLLFCEPHNHRVTIVEKPMTFPGGPSEMAAVPIHKKSLGQWGDSPLLKRPVGVAILSTANDRTVVVADVLRRELVVIDVDRNVPVKVIGKAKKNTDMVTQIDAPSDVLALECGLVLVLEPHLGKMILME